MPTLAAYFHDLSPYIWRISGEFGIRWYGAAYVAGFIIGYVILLRLARAGHTAIPYERVADAMLWLIGGTLLGGRIGYIVFYQPAILTKFFSDPPWWGPLALNQGGMASHGAMVGLVLAAWRISRGWKDDTGRTFGRCSVLHVTDIVALLAPFGVLLGRLANFVNGELLGAIVTPPGKGTSNLSSGGGGPWWAVQFPQELDLPLDKVPGLLDPATKPALIKLAGQIAPGRPIEVGLHELARHPAAFMDQLRPLLASRHPSQLYQAFAEGVVLGSLLWLIWWRPWQRKGAHAAPALTPGVITGWTFIIYGVLRVITEIWRLPDPQFAQGRPFGLSRGQWLSVGLVIAGVGVLGWTRRALADRRRSR